MTKRIKNQKGVATVDYLFAFVLVGGFSFLIFTLSLSLSMVEVVQYITFAAARNYYAGNESPEAQYRAGLCKFYGAAGITDPTAQAAGCSAAPNALSPLFKNGWFELDTATLTVDDLSKSADPALAKYKDQPAEFNLFHGVAVNFIMHALDFRIPFFGSTTMEDQSGKKKPFSALIGSYLGRETSYQECENFMIDRWKAIKNLQNNVGAAYSQVNDSATYIPSDNGC